MDLIVFGGSFDPIHNGHIYNVKYALEKFKDGIVHVVPSNSHPHQKKFIDFQHRYVMCKLAFNGIKRVVVNPIEKTNGYVKTYDTLRYFTNHYDANVHLLVGSDIALQTNSWYKWNEIEKEYDVIFVKRTRISSTMIRNSILNGKSIENFVCKDVCDYIKSNNLYGE